MAFTDSATPSGALMDWCSLGCDSRQIEAGFGVDNHPPVTGKLKVGGDAIGKDLAEKFARLIPHVHTVATPGINVAFTVAVNTWVYVSWSKTRAAWLGAYRLGCHCPQRQTSFCLQTCHPPQP